MDAATTAKVLGFVAAALAAVASIVRAVRDDVTGALTAAGLALVAFASAIGNL